MSRELTILRQAPVSPSRHRNEGRVRLAVRAAGPGESGARVAVPRGCVVGVRGVGRDLGGGEGSDRGGLLARKWPGERWKRRRCVAQNAKEDGGAEQVDSLESGHRARETNVG